VGPKFGRHFQVFGVLIGLDCRVIYPGGGDFAFGGLEQAEKRTFLLLREGEGEVTVFDPAVWTKLQQASLAVHRALRAAVQQPRPLRLAHQSICHAHPAADKQIVDPCERRQPLDCPRIRQIRHRPVDIERARVVAFTGPAAHVRVVHGQRIGAVACHHRRMLALCHQKALAAEGNHAQRVRQVEQLDV